jgi:transcriptional regulator of aromatic amino acid metabolism
MKIVTIYACNTQCEDKEVDIDQVDSVYDFTDEQFIENSIWEGNIEELVQAFNDQTLNTSTDILRIIRHTINE